MSTSSAHPFTTAERSHFTNEQNILGTSTFSLSPHSGTNVKGECVRQCEGRTLAPERAEQEQL